MLLKAGDWISDIYPIGAIILFMCLAWMASMMLERLRDDLPTADISHNMEINPQMMKWKQNYQLINSFIEKIVRFFGVILLAFMSRQLFRFVCYFFFLVSAVRRQKAFEHQLLLIFYLIKHGAYVFSLTWVSHRIKTKVFH